jgi:MoaA/NifB/PqqE/SkfB family radical SAM enzyme
MFLRFRNDADRLSGLLTGLESKSQNCVSLDQMLETLDASKPALFESLRKRFDSPIEAKAVTQKILNLSLAKYHFRARSTVVLSKPFGLVADPSNSCNLACPGCVHSRQVKELKLFEWNPGLMPESRLTAFLKTYGPNATHAMLCNYGEPLTNPDTPKYIRLAKSYRLHTMLSTNFSLPRFDADAYAQSGLDYMNLSIDGATQPVYERFRRKGNLAMVFENIRKLVDAKKRAGRSMPILSWRFLCFEHNIHEIPLAIEKARELGLDEFNAEPAWDISWDDPAIRPAQVEPVRVKFSPDSRAAVVENWNPFPANPAFEEEFEQTWADKSMDATPNAPGPACEYLYKSITMDAGGRIFPCCCSPSGKKDLTFARFDAGTGGGEFNSDKHQRSRLAFVDRQAYQQDREARGFDGDPYCVRCEWDKTADPSSTQIRNYFQAARVKDNASLDTLANWTAGLR